MNVPVVLDENLTYAWAKENEFGIKELSKYYGAVSITIIAVLNMGLYLLALISSPSLSPNELITLPKSQSALPQQKRKVRTVEKIR